MPDLRPDLASLAVPDTAIPSDPQAQSHHHQLDVGRAYTTRGEYYKSQIPFNLQYGAHLVNDVTGYPPHNGELHLSPSGHGVR